jgi:hypothetical protein
VTGQRCTDRGFFHQREWLHPWLKKADEDDVDGDGQVGCCSLCLWGFRLSAGSFCGCSSVANLVNQQLSFYFFPGAFPGGQAFLAPPRGDVPRYPPYTGLLDHGEKPVTRTHHDDDDDKGDV